MGEVSPFARRENDILENLDDEKVPLIDIDNDTYSLRGNQNDNKNITNKQTGWLISGAFDSELIANAVLFDSAVSHSEDSAFTHHLYAPYNFDGYVYIGKIEVKRDESQSENAYNISDCALIKTDFPQTDTISIAELYGLVKTHFDSFYKNHHGAENGREAREAEMYNHAVHDDAVMTMLLPNTLLIIFFIAIVVLNKSNYYKNAIQYKSCPTEQLLK